MSHLDYPACHESPIGDALRRIRLRIDRPRWVGDHWVQVTVKQRAQRHASEIAGAKRRPDQRWHPPEGRESPREVLMEDRCSRVRYRYPGCMRFLHGKAPPLVGSKLLYRGSRLDRLAEGSPEAARR